MICTTAFLFSSCTLYMCEFTVLCLWVRGVEYDHKPAHWTFSGRSRAQRPCTGMFGGGSRSLYMWAKDHTRSTTLKHKRSSTPDNLTYNYTLCTSNQTHTMNPDHRSPHTFIRNTDTQATARFTQQSLKAHTCIHACKDYIHTGAYIHTSHHTWHTTGTYIHTGTSTLAHPQALLTQHTQSTRT